MGNDIALAVRADLAAPLDASGSIDLLGLVLTGLKPSSAKGYRKDLADFARFAGTPTTEAALWRLLRLSPAEANAVVLAYQAAMEGERLSASTIARRLAALRRVASRARRVGLTTIDLEVDAPRTEAFRDCTGPGADGWDTLLEHVRGLAAAGDVKAVRDLAIVLLLHDRALRRGEVAGLDLVDVDLERPAVQVLGKGKRAKEWLTINDRTRAAIAAWITVRGDREGALFSRVDRAGNGDGRLNDESINRLVKGLAARAGLVRTVRAHGLRHQAITGALDAGWSPRDVKAFSRHQKIDTVMIYDDRRTDVGGQISRSIGQEKRRRRSAGKSPLPGA